VGANRGQFALIARRVFPHTAIYSFEPLEEASRVFKKIFANDVNTHLYPYAIGPESTSSTIHVTKADDSSSMLPVTETLSAIFPAVVERETRQVKVLPLSQVLVDGLIPPASLLKIDVQGFEFDVLRGCEDLLGKFSHLYVECSFIELYKGQALGHQIIDWLADKGFVLTGVYNMYYEKNGRAVQGDFLFCRTE
jgi:FkbM family methyltransferase